MNNNGNRGRAARNTSAQSNPKGQETMNTAAVQGLINVAAKKLGMTPQQLARGIESGEIEKTLRSGGKNGEFSAAAAALNDPQALQRLMSDPKTAELIAKLRNGR